MHHEHIRIVIKVFRHFRHKEGFTINIWSCRRSVIHITNSTLKILLSLVVDNTNYTKKLHLLDEAADARIGLVNSKKTEYMTSNTIGDIKALNQTSVKKPA